MAGSKRVAEVDIELLIGPMERFEIWWDGPSASPTMSRIVVRPLAVIPPSPLWNRTTFG